MIRYLLPNAIITHTKNCIQIKIPIEPFKKILDETRVSNPYIHNDIIISNSTTEAWIAKLP